METDVLVAKVSGKGRGTCSQFRAPPAQPSLHVEERMWPGLPQWALVP